MRITKQSLRQAIRIALKENINSAVIRSKAIQDYVLMFCRAVDAKYGEITVDDVLNRISADTRGDIGEFQLFDYVEEGSPEANFLLECDYNDLVAVMMNMVEVGTLSDGYEDFYALGEA